MAYKAGDVILIPFPYRDRLAESTRPAVVVSGDAYNQQGDLVIAAITSHTPRFATDYGLGADPNFYYPFSCSYAAPA